MKKRSTAAVVAVCATCAVVGASVSGIASSSAATKAPSTSTAATAPTPPDGGPGGPGGPGGGPGGRPGGPGGHDGGPGGAIHSEQVRPDPDGTGFVTEVSDRGTLTKVDGTKLTIKEGTATETLDTVVVVADGSVTVRRNGATAKLSDLKVGDHVRVSKDGTNTRIDASTAAFEKAREAEHAAHEQEQKADASWPKA